MWRDERRSSDPQAVGRAAARDGRRGVRLGGAASRAAHRHGVGAGGTGLPRRHADRIGQVRRVPGSRPAAVRAGRRRVTAAGPAAGPDRRTARRRPRPGCRRRELRPRRDRHRGRLGSGARGLGALCLPVPGATRQGRGRTAADRGAPGPSRGGRGPVRVLVGPRFPAGLPAPGPGGTAAGPAARPRAHGDRRASGTAGHRRTARHGTAAAARHGIRPSQHQAPGAPAPRRRRAAVPRRRGCRSRPQARHRLRGDA